MNQRLSWGKKLFNSTLNICQDGVQVGFIHQRMFSSTSIVELKGEAYVLVREGFINPSVMVRDKSTHQLLATIVPQPFSNSAIVYLSTGEKWQWSAKGILGAGRWELSSLDGMMISGDAKFTKRGAGISNTPAPLPTTVAVLLANNFAAKRHITLIYMLIFILFITLRAAIG